MQPKLVTSLIKNAESIKISIYEKDNIIHLVSIKNTYLHDNIINTVGRSHPISNMCDIIYMY
jgi:hypothetical protein